ncbi:hypothetical protein Tco_0635579 [Tanacetum coccineum]
MRELEGEWIMKKEMRMISKDGTIYEFPVYTSSNDEVWGKGKGRRKGGGGREEKKGGGVGGKGGKRGGEGGKGREDVEEDEEEEEEESEKKRSKEASEMGSNSEPPGYAAIDNDVDDTDDESNDQELEAHYMYMAHIHEVTSDSVDNSGPIFDDEPMHKVQTNNDNYNVFAMENEHPKEHESSSDMYLTEQGDTNITIDSLDICYDRAQDDQDETDDLDQERDLLASLIQKLKCEIDDSKNRNKFLESSNKELVDKLKGEIEDFKTKNKSLESSNNHFKEANNELSKTNQLMFKDLKKFQAELDKYNSHCRPFLLFLMIFLCDF